MALPEALKGDSWTKETARAALPILIWCAKNGKTITYGQLDQEIVNRGLGHHVMAVQYGYPAGSIGSALIETEEEWGEPIPPLNAIVVNASSGLPGKGVNYYLEDRVPGRGVTAVALAAESAGAQLITADSRAG